MKLSFFERLIISFKKGINPAILLLFPSILFIQNKKPEIGYLFFLIFLITLLFRIFLFKYVFNLEIYNSKIFFYIYENFFKIKKIVFEIDQIENLFYRPSTRLENGNIILKSKNKQDFFSYISFSIHSSIHQKLEDFCFNKDFIKVQSLLENNSKHQSNENYINTLKIKTFNKTIFSVIILMLLIFQVVIEKNDLLFIIIFIFLVFLILISTGLSHKKILFDVNVNENKIQLFSIVSKKIEIEEIQQSVIKEIKYSKKFLMMSGELEVLVNENEQQIYSILLPDSNIMNKKINLLVEKLKKSTF